MLDIVENGMGISTGIIKYNLHDRGRKQSGSPRYFNVPKLMALVNAGEIQEMVEKGDLVGYLGHDIRKKFGLNPPEAALQNGNLVPIEPAFVTTYLKVYDDGTVEHEARFLDTPLGKVAQEWFQAKIGGFSSVVEPDERNPSMFWGFDYVRSPNFHGNRGYVMDDSQWDRLTNRQKIQEFEARCIEQQVVMDAIEQKFNELQTANTDLMAVNQQLTSTLDSLAKQHDETRQQLSDLQANYDALQPTFAPIMRLSINSDNWLSRSISPEVVEQVSVFDSANSYTKPDSKNSSKAIRNLMNLIAEY